MTRKRENTTKASGGARVVVMGVGGMGSSVARLLASCDEVAELILADGRLAEAERLARSLGVPNAFPRLVDARDERSLHDALDGADVLVNCTGPFHRLGLPIITAAVEAGVSYVDICDDPDATARMLALDGMAQDAGVCCIVGLGASPGLTNLTAVHAASRFDQVDEVNFYWFMDVADRVDSSADAVVDHAYHMADGDVPQFLDGELVYVPALSGRQEVDFGAPAGSVEVAYVGHPEPLTVPDYIPGVRQVVNKGGLFPGWAMRRLRCASELGLTGQSSVEIGGAEVKARDFLLTFERQHPSGELAARTPRDSVGSGMLIELAGNVDGESVRQTVVREIAPMADRSGTAATAAGARILASDGAAITGVRSPESLDYDAFIAHYRALATPPA